MCKRIVWLYVLGIMCICGLRAQDLKYRLYLTDKAGSTYCALSERAMQRRANQGIALDSTDITVSPRYLQTLREAGYRICVTSRWVNTVVVGHDDNTPIDSAALAAFPFVRKIEPVESQETVSSAPKSRDWETTVPTDSVVESFRTPMFEVNGQALYDAGYRGKGMLITMLDGGYTNASRYPVLYDKVVGWHDFYTDQDSTAFFESSTHGTQCLSLMAADSSTGIWGTAPDARFFLIRTEFSPREIAFEEDAWVAGAEMADSLGSDLLTASLGYYNKFDDARFNHTTDELLQGTAFIAKGAEIATKKGMLVINSAGNEGRASSTWGKITFPANVEDIFTIGATDTSRVASDFSSRGWLTPYVKPDVACRGKQAYILSALTGEPATGNGTSYAAPFLCGLMASLWSAAPTLTPAQLRQVVRESASQSAAPDSLVGYGMPDFQVALQLALKLAEPMGIQEVKTSAAEDGDFADKATEGKISHARYFDLQGRPLTTKGQELPSNCHFVVEKGGKIKVLRK
ncbi:MAG: S8 family serine peptidase [Bacteroidales bacterium]|nr:S8 family serine peptidase [Bacteroidales bacterium]